jgi:hypothetical protein
VALSATLLGGRYELNEPIGAGGFSEVWRATDTVLARPVAIKFLHASYAHQAEALARFRAEARYAGALAHQNIARIYDYAEPADSVPYLVMELIDGPSLARVLSRGALEAARAMDVVAQAAAGLQAAHDAGLIHRDIKPANLLLCPDGTVKITDFGISHAVGSAPVTMTGTLIGTPSYMAPERVAGARATPASDLYALGVVAYECLAGAPPFSGVPLEVALAHRERPLPPLPPSVPVEVGALVMQLTAKDACWRPASAAEVARRAAALRDGLRDGLKAGTAGARPVPAAAAAAVPSAGASATSADGGRLPPPPADPARVGRLRHPADPARVGRLRHPADPARVGRLRHPADPARVGRLRHPAVLAVTSLVLAGLTSLVLVSVLGFSPALHQAGAPSVAAPGTPQGGPASRATGRHDARQARAVNPGGQTSAPAGMSSPAANEAVLTTGQPARKPGRGPRHDRGHGHRGGAGPGPGQGGPGAGGHGGPRGHDRPGPGGGQGGPGNGGAPGQGTGPAGGDAPGNGNGPDNGSANAAGSATEALGG